MQFAFFVSAFFLLQVSAENSDEGQVLSLQCSCSSLVFLSLILGLRWVKRTCFTALMGTMLTPSFRHLKLLSVFVFAAMSTHGVFLCKLLLQALFGGGGSDGWGECGAGSHSSVSCICLS